MTNWFPSSSLHVPNVNKLYNSSFKPTCWLTSFSECQVYHNHTSFLIVALPPTSWTYWSTSYTSSWRIPPLRTTMAHPPQRMLMVQFLINPLLCDPDIFIRVMCFTNIWTDVLFTDRKNRSCSVGDSRGETAAEVTIHSLCSYLKIRSHLEIYNSATV